MEVVMARKKNVAGELIASMQEALAHAAGKPVKARVTKVRIVPVDVKAIRAKLTMTQAQMALLLGVSVSGYRKWEQGARQPHGAARTLLRVMEQEPAAVARVLKRAA
jgi:putative transcriptional regulator